MSMSNSERIGLTTVLFAIGIPLCGLIASAPIDDATLGQVVYRQFYPLEPLPIDQMVDELFEGRDDSEADDVVAFYQRELYNARFDRLIDKCRSRKERKEFCEAVFKRRIERRKDYLAKQTCREKVKRAVDAIGSWVLKCTQE